MSLDAYKQATDIANTDLTPTHPIGLGLARRSQSQPQTRPYCPAGKAIPTAFAPGGGAQLDEITFIHIRHANIFLAAVTRKNSNATMILAFLYKLVEVFTEYFKDVHEESIRDNFEVIYEFLDEMMDFGFPQTSESKLLRQYITQDSRVSEYAASLPVAATNAVSWRNEGIRHSRNEVFLDVIEKVNVLVSGSGNLLRSEIVGKLMMKYYLSGMPNLKLGLNDRLQFEASAANGGHERRGKSVEL